MNYDLKYGPQAQTPEQRAYVLQQMKSANPTYYIRVTSCVAALFTRYVAGELSWEQVRTLRNDTEAISFRRS